MSSAESSSPTDAELIEQFLSTGEQVYFTRLYDRHYGPLARFLARYGMDKASADERAHEALTALATKLDQFDRTRPVGPYIYMTALHDAIDRNRAVKRRPAISFHEIGDPSGTSRGDGRAYDPEDCGIDTAAEIVESREIHLLIQQGVELLEPKLRDVLYARYYQGMTDEAGAKALDIPVGSFNHYIRRAMRILRAKISQESGCTQSDLTVP